MISIFLLRSTKKNQEITSSLHSQPIGISFLSNKRRTNMILMYFKTGIEIITLSSFFYYFSLWLKKDTEKNLIWYFYGYCLLFLGSWTLNFSVINSFMLYTCPLMCMLLVIIHQDILQRNFISIKKEITPTNNPEYMEELVRSALAALNKSKNFYCVLEHTWDIKPFIKSDFLLHADLKQECISFLIESPTFDENKFIWCSTQGYVVAINAHWKIHRSQPTHALPPTATQWKEDAILITSKTDACVIKGNTTTRLFDIITRGKIHEQIPAHQLVQLLKMQVIQSPLLGEKLHESSHKRIINQQQNS